VIIGWKVEDIVTGEHLYGYIEGPHITKTDAKIAIEKIDNVEFIEFLGKEVKSLYDAQLEKGEKND